MSEEVRPFRVEVPQSALEDVRKRLEATRWVEDIVGGDKSYGVPQPFVRSLCDHWLHHFDWRALETRINSELNIVTDIEGVTLHAISRRSKRGDAIPLLLMHGWPSSFLEFLDVCEPLTVPPADQPAFHIVVASLPGCDFSTTRPGLTPQRTAALMVQLMERLGYRRFMIQGGNWGALLGMEIVRQFPDRVIGLHLNSVNGSPPPDRDSIPLTAEEESWVARYGKLWNLPHFAVLSVQPFTPAYAFNDSPAGLAAWIGEKLWDWADNRQGPGLPMDWMVGTIALCWFTQTIASSSMLYNELVRDGPEERYVAAPTAAALFAEEFVRIPRAWAERHYNIVQWTEYERGGHFPATEVPDLFVGDLRLFAQRLAAR